MTYCRKDFISASPDSPEAWLLVLPFVQTCEHDSLKTNEPSLMSYEGRLPLTSWWRKSSNMTVGQSSLISLAHHCYD